MNVGGHSLRHQELAGENVDHKRGVVRAALDPSCDRIGRHDVHVADDLATAGETVH